MSAKQLIRHTWKVEEDDRLRELVLEMGLKRWQAISTILASEFGIPHINGKACRERYKNHLADNVNKSQWAKGEVDRLFLLYRTHGARWSEIAKQMPGRTDNGIKNYFYATLRRSLRRMLKALGRHKSSNELGKVKPHVLTQLFNICSEDDADITTIVHDVVVNFADEKHMDLTEEQYSNYNKVLLNLKQLNQHYLVEKSIHKEVQRQREKEQHQQRQCKIIYRIKRYIKETHQSVALINRIENKQNIFKLQTSEKRGSVRKKQQFKSIGTKIEVPEEPSDLQFVQPSQMPSYLNHPQQFLEPIQSNLSELFLPMITQSPMLYLHLEQLKSGLMDQFQQRLKSNLLCSDRLQSNLSFLDRMKSNPKEEEGDQRDIQPQQIQSLYKNFFDLQSLEKGISSACYPMLMEQMAQYPQAFLFQHEKSQEQISSYRSRPARIASVESNLGTGGGESQQFTDFYPLTARKSDPLQGLQRMQSDQP